MTQRAGSAAAGDAAERGFSEPIAPLSGTYPAVEPRVARRYTRAVRFPEELMRPGFPTRPCLVAAMVLLAATQMGPSCNNTNNHEPQGQQTFTSPQSKPIVLSADGSRLYVANTTSGTVSVIDTSDNSLIAAVDVGLEPVGLALKPDGSELWVSNHLSDSVSVIDLVPGDTELRVIETVQDLDANGVTQFDEPVGIAFASNAKAYVALSSRNDVAVVDTATYQVTGRLHITAQEPRSLTVRNGRLYVAAFESNNQSELSVCPSGTGGPQCTLDASDLQDFIISSPNIPGADARIVIDPDVPDRDLFVFDTATDTLDESVSGVGTLLYDLVVDSNDEVFITQTDARNDVNGGNNGSGQNNLIELENRMFLNQIGHVDCGGGGGCGAPGVFELEPAPGNPVPTALATPYGIAISDDDSTLVATAAGTSRLMTVDPGTGAVLDTLDMNAGVPADFGQQIPKGVALRSDGLGAPQTAYVLNTLENTVSVVDVSNPNALVHVTKFGVGNDPTPDAIRRGRIAFNNAFASTSGTFSCESCHPDGNTDQLLWRIGGACFFGACNGEDEIRSTMPVRGLRNTLPLHWDGSLGDPFGGINGAVGTGGSVPPSCDISDGDDHDCFLDLVVHSLSGVMCDQSGSCPLGGNELSAQEQDDMAFFLANVSYPPARSRRMDDAVTASANQGFSDFFVDVGGLGTFVGVATCADMDSGCHALPLGADTNSTTLGGFDAPTMRGMTDRWLQFSLGITNAEETLEWVKTAHSLNVGLPITVNTFPAELPFDPDEGFEEDVTLSAAFAVFQPVYGKGVFDIFQMIEEASTGHSGALGRQVTLNAATTVAPELTDTETVLDALEAADDRGQVNLRGVGTRRAGATFAWIVLSYRDDGTYKNANDSISLTRADLLSEAAAGDLVLTLTGALPENFGADDYRQPLLSVNTIANGPTGNPDLPLLPQDNPMNLRAIDVRSDATIVVSGEVVSGSISCVGGSFTPYCDSQEIDLTLSSIPPEGLHLLQVQNPGGPLSVELPICVSNSGVNPCK
jgi:YVTN family beta-propeller protein